MATYDKQMRWHLAVAVLMLTALVAAGVWYARPSSSQSEDPVALRNTVAQSPAVVVTDFIYGVPDATTPRSVLPDPPTMTFIRDQGWVWQAPGGPGDTQPGLVISAPARTLAAVAPGCYESIPPQIAPGAWEVPGVTVMRNLATGQGVTKDGDQYTYTVKEADGTSTVVSEDLQGIGQNRSYSAKLTHGGLSSLFTVREATAAEQAAATRLLTTAHPSATTTLEVDYRVLGDAPADGPFQTLHLVSPKDCPENIAMDYSQYDPQPPAALDLFRETPRGAFLTGSLRIAGGAVTVTHVVAVTGFIAPSTAALLQAATSDDPVHIHPGTMFAVLVHEPAPTIRNVALVYRVSSCQASAWFPCGD